MTSVNTDFIQRQIYPEGSEEVWSMWNVELHFIPELKNEFFRLLLPLFLIGCGILLKNHTIGTRLYCFGGTKYNLKVHIV